MRQTIMLMAACAALLASCTNEEMNEGLGIDTPIQVTASVEGIMTTRADNTTDNLDNFGLYIKDKDGGYDTKYGGENIKASKPEGESVWTLANEVLYQGSGQTYFAYAPYKEGHTGESLTFTVDAYQATNDLQGSDLLYAAGKVESAKLDITLAHKLSKLTVTVKKKGETNPIEVGDVTLRGTVPTATITLSNGTVAASGTETDIKMWKSSTGIYECILVPQATAFGVSFTYGGDTYLWESSPYTFEGGNAYTLALTFDQEVSAGEVTVNEWGKPKDDLGEGTATETDYTYDASTNTYTVYTAEGLKAWAKAVSNNGYINCTLAADINMTDGKWESITYYGTFDGNGHTITGLDDCLIEGNLGTVRNLILAEPTIFAETIAGAVACVNSNVIENCHVVGGEIIGGSQCGGIAGNNSRGGSILACSSSAEVTGSRIRTGGIAAHNEGRVLACYATGSVTGSVCNGAIVGLNFGITTACYWSGEEENGVGEGSAEGVEEVAGGDWTSAMTEMNTALTGSGYQWELNPDDKTGKRPLIITNE